MPVKKSLETYWMHHVIYKDLKSNDNVIKLKFKIYSHLKPTFWDSWAYLVE